MNRPWIPEDPDADDHAELRAQLAEEERAEEALAYADGRFSNYPDGWGDAPW